MSREQFEKFAIAEFGAINLLRWPETGKYQVDLYEFAWQAFQSGHAAGLEAAAKFLDEWNTAIGDDLAKSIRAMKEPK